MIRNHPAHAILDLDGEKGFIAQTRGAVSHIIKCIPVQVTYRHRSSTTAGEQIHRAEEVCKELETTVGETLT